MLYALQNKETLMKTLKDKIVAGCIIFGVIMTLFPPQTIQTFQKLLPSQGGNRLVDEEIEYRFIGGEKNFSSGFYEQTSIAFDRLLLQYIILAGAGFSIYLLKSKRERQENA